MDGLQVFRVLLPVLNNVCVVTFKKNMIFIAQTVITEIHNSFFLSRLLYLLLILVILLLDT